MQIKKIYKMIELTGDSPQFVHSLHGTYLWLVGYSKLVSKYNYQNFESAFSANNKKSYCDKTLSIILSHFLLSINHVASLRDLANVKKLPTLRSASISWYYTFYSSASMMIKLKNPEANISDHSVVKKGWLNMFCNDEMLYPYNCKLDSLEKKYVENQIHSYSNQKARSIKTKEEALANPEGAFACKLNGHATWKINEIMSRLKKERGYENFKSKVNRVARDEALAKAKIGFMDVIYGARITTNYRKALPLFYGNDVIEIYEDYLIKLYDTALNFHLMATTYLKAKVSEDLWSIIIEDIKKEVHIDNIDEILID